MCGLEVRKKWRRQMVRQNSYHRIKGKWISENAFTNQWQCFHYQWALWHQPSLWRTEKSSLFQEESPLALRFNNYAYFSPLLGGVLLRKACLRIMWGLEKLGRSTHLILIESRSWLTKGCQGQIHYKIPKSGAACPIVEEEDWQSRPEHRRLL